MKTLQQILEKYGLDMVEELYEELKESQKNYARESLRLASHYVRPKEFRFYDDYERCEQSILSEENLPSHK